MSYKATNWAIRQRGLSPVTKLVLLYLCDRHNPDFGCFPSQDQLAADAEISRASLNVHLEKLETTGLISRHRRHAEGSHRRKSTRYVLGFEDDFGASPCPDAGRAQRPRYPADGGLHRLAGLARPRGCADRLAAGGRRALVAGLHPCRCGAIDRVAAVGGVAPDHRQASERVGEIRAKAERAEKGGE